MRWALAIAATCAAVAVALGSGRAQEDEAPADEPELDLEVPRTWRPLPGVAAEAQRAALEAAATEQLELETWAWGDPGDGCFGLVQDARMPAAGSAAQLHETLRASLGEADELSIDDWQMDDDGAASRLRFTAGPLQGQARVITSRASGVLRAVSAACFYNEREPELSARQCERFVETIAIEP